MIPLIIGGPSGAGKSEFGKHLQACGWLHLEADQFPKDGINELGLRNEWNAFWNDSKPQNLADALKSRAKGRKGVVLSLPSVAIPSIELIAQCEQGLKIRFLWGDPRYCLSSYLDRERKSGRGLTPSLWDANNRRVYEQLSSSGYHRYLVDAFDTNGARLSNAEVQEKL